MDCSIPSNVVSIAHGYRGGKFDEKDIEKPARRRIAALDAAIAAGLKLRKTLAGKELYEAATKWVTKSGLAKDSPTFAATLAKIICNVRINRDTDNPIW